MLTLLCKLPVYVVLAIFLSGLLTMIHIAGCGGGKGVTPKRETTNTTIQEDVDRGKAFLEAEEYDEAADAFADALGKNPDSDEVHYYLALTYARWGKGEQAVSAYRRLLTSNSPKADDEELVVRIAGFLGLELDWYETTRLTVNEARDSAPAFSPDGRQIAFVSTRDGNFEIYLMGADGSDPRRLTVNEASDLGPSFSPDGREIVFVSDRDGSSSDRIAGDFEVYAMDLDGSNLRRLTFDEMFDGDPSFSPDGREIVFVSDGDRGDSDISAIAGNFDVYVMNSDGSHPRRLTLHAASDWGSSFSPDGRQIVFMSDRDGNFEIYAMGSDGSNPRRLTENDAWDSAPSFSPDGRQIAFASDRDGAPEIYAMGSDGSNPRRLTINEVFDGDPSFSPDGRQIAFDSHRDGNPEIYLMDLAKPIGKVTERIAEALGVKLGE